MKTDREDKIERARVLVVEAKRTEPWTMGRSAVAAELLGMLPEILDAIGEARARAERAEAQRDEALAKLAELREECVHSFDDDAGGGCRVESFACLVCGGDGETRADVTHAEGCAVAATPTDLDAERDRRVRAEALREAADDCEDRARTNEGTAIQAQDYGDDPTWWRGMAKACRDAAHRLRARAEEVARG